MFHDLARSAIGLLDLAKVEVGSSTKPQIEVRRICLGAPPASGGWDQLRREISSIGGERAALYVFKLVDGNQSRLVADAFSKARETVANLPRDHRGISDVLYVGSSRKLSTRLKDHLGLASPKTYGLKLASWLPSQIEIDLHFAFYDANTSRAAIAVLEDALWERHKPMFGRKGAR